MAGVLTKFRNNNLRFNWYEQAMAVLLMPLTIFQYGLFKVTQSFKRWTIQCSGEFNMRHNLFSAVLSGLNLHLQQHVTSVSTQSDQLQSFFAKGLGSD